MSVGKCGISVGGGLGTAASHPLAPKPYILPPLHTHNCSPSHSTALLTWALSGRRQGVDRTVAAAG